MTMSFSCGHEGEVPPNMGRGKAREQRLAKYFGRRCPTCQLQSIKDLAARLTRLDGTPYTAAEQADYVARHTR